MKSSHPAYIYVIAEEIPLYRILKAIVDKIQFNS